MAKAKTAPDSDKLNLADRIDLFFRVQPYGQPAGLSDLMVDITEKGLAALVPAEECEAVLKRMTTDGINLPEKKEDRLTTARAKVVIDTLGNLVKAGKLTPVEIKEPNRTEKGYYYSGSHVDPAVKGETKRVPIDQIKVDPAYQMRAKGTVDSVVARYAAVADRLPPVTAFDVGEDKLILVEGFHRMKAFDVAGIDTVPVFIIKGTKEDAKLYAIKSNASHGYARSMDDIKAAVGAYLKLPGRKNDSVAEVARAVDCAWATADKCIRFWMKMTGEKRSKHKNAPTGDSKPDTTATVPNTPAPAGGEIEPTDKPTGIKDRLGNDVPADLVPAFTDTRFGDAVKNILENLKFLRDIRPDGYAISSILVKERSGILNEIEFGTGQLQQSVPYCVCPADAKTVSEELAAARRRGWMDAAEWQKYVKAGGKGSKLATEGGSEEAEVTGASHVRGSDSTDAAEGADNAQPATAA